MLQLIDCAGNPRDMGQAQGEACRAAVTERLLRAGLQVPRSRLARLSAYASGTVRGQGVGREIIRHYTHLSERIDGLARGAQVPVDSLLSLHVNALSGRGEVHGDAAISQCGPAEDGRNFIQRSLPEIEGPGSQWIARRSRPEVGFESVEVTLPWLASAVAGVNSAGLSACFVSAADSEDVGRVTRRPPPLLLVQECLQRFDAVEGGLDWCGSRPVSGHGTVLLADPTGRFARIDFVGDELEIVRGEKSQLVAGVLSDGLERVRAASDEGLASLSEFSELSGEIGEPISALRVDPENRLLEVRRGAKREDLRLEV
jgi:hypothetical protein